MVVDATTRRGRRRLRGWMVLFLLALAVPSGVLVWHAYGQLKWEAFHQYRQLAEEVARRIDARAAALLAAEEARGFTDYQFLVVEGEGEQNFVQRGPLSAYPVRSDIPGLLGWFQVDTEGRFSSPLLPASRQTGYGLSAQSRRERAALESRIQSILGANRLVAGGTSGRATQADADDRQAGRRPLAQWSVERLDGAAARGDTRVDDALASSMPRKQPLNVLADRPRKTEAAGAGARDAEAPVAQSAFDALSARQRLDAPTESVARDALGRVEELELTTPFAEDRRPDLTAAREPALRSATKQRARRKEVELTQPSSPLPAPAPAVTSSGVLPDAIGPGAGTPIRTFESELDPFELNLLESGHFVLYRKVWRDGQRYIQGALIERAPFLTELANAAFADTALSRMSTLGLAWRGDVLAVLSEKSYQSRFSSAADLSGALLYRTRLSAPLAQLELVFTVTRLPTGPGAGVIAWSAGVLALVLVVGVWLVYRLALRQMALLHQQQDFVSAVSHELRTPITGIRMYGEMLREGWASEEKKRSYYDFIVQESERLSRLVSNVLQLARLERNEVAVNLEHTTVAAVVDGLRSRIDSQVQHAGFESSIECDEAIAALPLEIDPDALSQCVINLVDNAIKFSADSPVKRIDIACTRDAGDGVAITVRDHGPGIERDQMRKIFTLFYRTENELTRETVGTGIGLALVQRLMSAMGGSVDVASAQPGAVFTLRLPAAARSEA